MMGDLSGLLCQPGGRGAALASYTPARDGAAGCAHGERIRHPRPEPDSPGPLGKTGCGVLRGLYRRPHAGVDPPFPPGERRVAAYGVASGLGFFAYATLAERLWRVTVGKAMVGLEVRSVVGPMTLGKAAVRNIPKLFWFLFPLLDTIAGLLVDGDPRQRFSDRILGTTVAQSSLVHVRLHRIETPQ